MLDLSTNGFAKGCSIPYMAPTGLTNLSGVVLNGDPMTQEHALTEGDLAQFIGTSQYYRHNLGLLYTDGVKHVADQGEAYWLLDAIASWQNDSRIRNDEMLQNIQFWKLTVHEDHSATLTCERDTDDVVLTQEIPFTDFPLKHIKFYLQEGVILLPSEY